MANDKFAYEVRDLRNSRQAGAEGSAQIMRDEWNDAGCRVPFAQKFQHALIKPHLGLGQAIEGLSAAGARKKVIAAAEARQSIEDCQHIVRERHDVRGIAFHTLGRNSPQLLIKIEFPPAGAGDFGSTLAGQHQNLEQRAIGVAKRRRCFPGRPQFHVGKDARPRLARADDGFRLQSITRACLDTVNQLIGCPIVHAPQHGEHMVRLSVLAGINVTEDQVANLERRDIGDRPPAPFAHQDAANDARRFFALPFLRYLVIDEILGDRREGMFMLA